MDQEEISTKYAKVRHWLESFGDDIIPNYEVTEETITYLHKMCEHNKKMDKLTKLLLGDINVKCNEYQMEINLMKELLEGVGLPVYTLSTAGKSSLKMLSQLASVLKMKDVKKSSYLLALNDFSSKQSNIFEELSKKQADITSQLSQAKSTLNSLETMSSNYQRLAECSAVDVPLADKKEREIERMEAKSDSYERQLSDDKKNMNVNVEKHLHHGALVRLNEELKCLKEELKPLQTKYQGYRSLPPDIQMARVKIEETKRYMKKLESELQADIDYFSL